MGLGCGSGKGSSLSGATLRPNVRFIGVDASADAIDAAAALAPEQRISLRYASLDGQLPFDDASVELVYSQNLPECLPNPEEFVRQSPISMARTMAARSETPRKHCRRQTTGASVASSASRRRSGLSFVRGVTVTSYPVNLATPLRT